MKGSSLYGSGSFDLPVHVYTCIIFKMLSNLRSYEYYFWIKFYLQKII